MNSRRYLSLLVIFALSAGAAFALRTTIYQLVIVPLAYLWWLLKLYYHLVPQIYFWILLIFIVIYSAARGLLLTPPMMFETKGTRKIPHGPVELLSGHIHKRRYGIYYKWLIAHRLGKIARELLDQREGHRIERRFSHLSGRDWNPPPEVAAYLESGLNGSFADYPYSRWSRPRQTPLDIHPKDVVEYLESEMEIHRNGNL